MSFTYTQTYSGKMFDILNPKAEDICFEDIAQSLSKICRFKGHTEFNYTVAQHSRLVASVVSRQTKDPRVRWAALMHDAHEAYVGDIPGPWKPLVSVDGWSLEFISETIDELIQEALLGFTLDLTEEEKALVHRADRALICQEKQLVLHVTDIQWSDSFMNFELATIEEVHIEPESYVKTIQEFENLYKLLTNDLVILKILK